MKQNPILSMIFASLFMVACGSSLSAEEVEEQSEGTLMESISETIGFPESEVEVTDYSLIKVGDQIYEGVLQTEINNMNQTFDVTIKVDSDSDEFIVEWELMSEF